MRRTNLPLQAARDFASLLLKDAGGRWPLIGILCVTLVGSLAEGVGLLMLVPIFNLIGIGNDGPVAAYSLLMGLGLYLLLIILLSGLVATRSVKASDQRRRFLDRLRGDLHTALLKTSWTCFQRQRASDIKQILTGEVERLGLCHLHMIDLAIVLLTAPALLIAALCLSPTLTSLTLVISAVGLVILQRLGRSGFSLGYRLGVASRAMQADLADDLAGFRVVKSFGSEQAREQKLRTRFADVRELQQKQVRIQSMEQAALKVMAAVTAAAVILAATLWLNQTLTAALAVILAFARLTQRGMGALRTWRQLEACLPAVIIYNNLLQTLLTEAEPADSAPLAPFQQTLSFQDVGFLAPDGRPILHGVSFDLPFGTLLAVTGPSGAGKSTLADIAAGLIGPASGQILLDGLALTPEHRPAWRRQVAVVPQDPFLFHDTIRANLLLAAPEASEADLWTALEAAAAADFVRSLPHGLDTVVGDRGGSVSGGERQRLAIARALLRHPRLLILDEATSALDGASEALVLNTLNRLRGKMTILAVTHRETTRRAAGCVLELAAGSALPMHQADHDIAVGS